MSEETVTQQPTIDPDQAAFQKLQNEFLQNCAKVGEMEYIKWLKRNEKRKLCTAIKKIDLKAKELIENKKKREEAAKPDLKVVPQA